MVKRDSIIRNLLPIFITLIFLLFPIKKISGNSNNLRAQSTGLKLVGQVGGPTQCVALNGNYAYLGVGLRIIVLDISDPASPKQVGATEVMGDFVTEIRIDGNTAYVTAGIAGLYLYDISNPSNPKKLSSYDSIGFSENVLISNNKAYLADGWAGIQILDISDKSNPTEISSIQTLGYGFDLTLISQHLYVASGGAGLRVVDISDPSKPVEISSYDTPGYSYGITSEGNKVYIADGWEGIRIVDVTNPDVPVEVGFYKTPGWAFDVDIVGNTAYVADAFKGLQVLDVSNAAAPKEIGSCGFSDANSHAGKVFVKNNIAFIADRNWGMRVLDVSNKISPAQISFWGPMTYAHGVAVVGQYLYIAGGKNGLRIVDVSDPNYAKEIGAYDTKSYATNVAVIGQYAYVSTLEGGLFVIDVADASNPKKVAGCHHSIGACRDSYIDQGLAYLANETGLDLIDVSNPLTPTLLGFIKLAEFPGGEILSAAVGVAANGTLAYVATERAGIKIIDVSNPANPKLIGQFRDMNFSQDVAIAQSFLYVADTDGLLVLDVSNPSQPQKIGFCETPGYAETVNLEGNMSLVSAGGGGLWIVDVSNPRAPIIKGGYNSPWYAQGATSQGQFIYLADQEGGIVILDKTTTGLNSENINTANKTIGFTRNIPEQESWNHQMGSFHTGSYQQDLDSIQNTRKLKNSNIKPGFKDYQNMQQLSISSRSASNLIVNNTSDSGPATLRWCMENAKSGDTISFDSSVFPPSNPATIYLNTSLPSLSQGKISIDGSNSGVILNGRNLSGNSNGININSSGNIIRGLQIIGFPYAGIFIQRAKNNIIGGNRANGKDLLGQGNLISGNGYNGIHISFADQNIVTGNLIGTDISGVNKMGNGGSVEGSGIWIGGSSGNRIGGVEQGERNIISGNTTHGVSFIQSMENTVINNYIGIDINGTSLLSNGDHGLAMELGSYGNLIKDNVIATAGRNSILINDWGSSYNVVIGNLLGMDRTGRSSFDGGFSAILIGQGAGFNRIGGTNHRERNVICGGDAARVFLGRQGAIGNLIIGNYIGTDVTGMIGISPRGAGVSLGNGSQRPFIGGMTEGEKNVISGNGWQGITVGQCVDNAWIAGNYIGVDASGTNPLWNNNSGILISVYAERNVVQGNLISGNPGIHSDGEKNIVRGNILANGHQGVQLAGNNNLVYRNKFQENNTQATDIGNNSWYWKNVGNYWSDYTGADLNNDGIGDTPYFIQANAVDNYPLIRASNTLTLGVNPQVGGNIERRPDKSSYEYGENVRLKAIPASSYTFSYWTGDITGNSNPIVVTMNTNKTVIANFNLLGGDNPIISLSPSSLNFGATTEGGKTSDQHFIISNTGGGTLDWSIMDNATWLSCSPASGIGNAVITVSVDPASLSVGTYIGTITISSANAANSPLTIIATLRVYGAGSTSPPFGFLDTPVDGTSGIEGSLPVTGWALDDIEVTKVDIWRDPVGGEPVHPNGYVYIGDAVFVGGARPDVEQVYPTYPLNYRAGWGYMMLTNFLPNSGNGTFRIHTIAHDKEGHSMKIGTKTITCDNAHATLPFGAIDTPAQGGIVSGSSYVNFGWALTPVPKSIPTDGSTIWLWIDGLPVGHPTYNNYRVDIATLFPGYANSQGAVGYYYLDTTKYTNGVHTIAWSVEDSAGTPCGIGSRYFTVMNTGGGSAADFGILSPFSLSLQSKDSYISSIAEVANMLTDYYSPVYVRKGYNLEALPEPIYPDANGVINIEAQEVDRIELMMNHEMLGESMPGREQEPNRFGKKKYSAYRVVGDELRPMPIGSTIDSQLGIFSWQLGPGFIGEYNFVFIKHDPKQNNELKRVRVHILPKKDNRF